MFHRTTDEILLEQHAQLFPTRDADVLALGLAQGIFSDVLLPAGPDAETVVECYYNAMVISDEYLEMTLTPSVQ